MANNKDDDKEKQMTDAAEFLVEQMQTQGAAASTVSNGHIILFKRSFLEQLLAKHPHKQEFSIFLKRPDFRN